MKVISGLIFDIENTGLNAIDLVKTFSHLLDLIDVLKRQNENLYISSYTILNLGSIGKYPGYEYLDEYLKINRVSEVFSTHEVTRLMSGIIDSCIYLEDRVEIDEIIIENFSMVPDIINHNHTKPLVESEIEKLSKIIARRDEQESESEVIGYIDSYILCAVSVKLATYKSQDLPAGDYNGEIYYKSPAKYIQEHYSNARKRWQTAKNVDSIRESILLRAQEISVETGLEIKTISIEIGEQFYESLIINNACGSLKYSRTTLEACARLLIDPNLIEPKPFRGSKNSKTQMHTESKGFAWRAHITKSSEAIRLMYWENNGTITFANVGPKHEEIIY